jgi:hypothetical protein
MVLIKQGPGIRPKPKQGPGMKPKPAMKPGAMSGMSPRNQVLARAGKMKGKK